MNNQNRWQDFVFSSEHEDKALHKGLASKDCMIICINVSTAMSIDYYKKGHIWGI